MITKAMNSKSEILLSKHVGPAHSIVSNPEAIFGANDIAASCGLLTLEKYADITGLPLQVCLGHVNKGLLPCITIGRRRLINIVALQRELAKKPFVFRG